jgi:transcriptional regulator of arginine metabolism
VVGTIAGDDTIMIVTAGADQAVAVAERLQALAGNRD